MPQIAELVQLWKEAYGVAKEATSVLNGKGPLLTSWAVCFDMFWNALLRYLICSTLTQDVISSALCLQAFTHFFEDNLIGAMNQSMVFIMEDIGWLHRHDFNSQWRSIIQMPFGQGWMIWSDIRLESTMTLFSRGLQSSSSGTSDLDAVQPRAAWPLIPQCTMNCLYASEENLFYYSMAIFSTTCTPFSETHLCLSHYVLHLMMQCTYIQLPILSFPSTMRSNQYCHCHYYLAIVATDSWTSIKLNNINW